MGGAEVGATSKALGEAELSRGCWPEGVWGEREDTGFVHNQPFTGRFRKPRPGHRWARRAPPSTHRRWNLSSGIRGDKEGSRSAPQQRDSPASCSVSRSHVESQEEEGPRVQSAWVGGESQGPPLGWAGKAKTRPLVVLTHREAGHRK